MIHQKMYYVKHTDDFVICFAELHKKVIEIYNKIINKLHSF